MKSTQTTVVQFLVGSCLFLTCSFSSYASDWNYDTHGADWTGTCATGTSQSPIDIVRKDTVKSDTPYTANRSYHGRTVEAVNNGHSVQFNPDGRTLEIIDNFSGKLEKFTLLQFHLHNGSEHTIDGERFALEAHFVHANDAYMAGEADGRIAVVGVFLVSDHRKDTGDSTWNDVLMELPQYENDTAESMTKLITNNYYNLMPKSSSVFTYEGSLTTPGCNEIVNWIVMEQPIKVSEEAIESFAASQHHHATYRDVQPLNGRIVTNSHLEGEKL